MSDWIRVDDRLPAYGRVLVFDSEGFVDTAFYVPDSNEWREHAIEDGEAVTHWQPLPEPPANTKHK